jgi:hypothetical protein
MDFLPWDNFGAIFQDLDSHSGYSGDRGRHHCQLRLRAGAIACPSQIRVSHYLPANWLCVRPLFQHDSRPLAAPQNEDKITPVDCRDTASVSATGGRGCRSFV